MRLEPWHRRALYAAFALLVVTGAVWLYADWAKDRLDADTWQPVAADMLALHGAGAMATLLLLGALAPLHVRRSWRSGRNRLTGPLMIAVNAVLIATAYGLYYAGSDTLRRWISDIHIVIGLALPASIVLHVWLGRRSAPAPQDPKDPTITSWPPADRGSR